MCYPKPGPRCSAHARSVFTRASGKVKIEGRNLRKANSELENARKTGKNLEQAEAKRASAYEKYMAAREDYKLAQREYIATPAGRKEYEEKQAAASVRGDEKKQKKIDSLLKQGQALSGWRENALIRMRENGELAIAKTKMYDTDGSLKFAPDSLGILSSSVLDEENQVGALHSAKFDSADRLSSVTYSSYAVRVDPQGNVLGADESADDFTWGYQVRADYVTFENADERDHDGMPIVEEIEYTTYFAGDSRSSGERPLSLEEASEKAKTHLSVANAEIHWDGGPRHRHLVDA